MEGAILVTVTAMLFGAATCQTWSDAASSFTLGPVGPRGDLRTMLTTCIVHGSCALLGVIAPSVVGQLRGS